MSRKTVLQRTIPAYPRGWCAPPKSGEVTEGPAQRSNAAMSIPQRTDASLRFSAHARQTSTVGSRTTEGESATRRLGVECTRVAASLVIVVCLGDMEGNWRPR
jgi:hypothetical protein